MAAARGLKEELAISIVPGKMKKIRDFQLFCFDDDSIGVHDHEFTELYLASYDGEFTGISRNVGLA